MRHQPITWNADALSVPMAPDPDRDARYRAMRARQMQDAHRARPSVWQRLREKVAA